MVKNLNVKNIGKNYLQLVDNFCRMKIHLGEIIEKAVRDKKYSISFLAERLYVSCQTAYNIFQSQDVPIETILKTGKIIQHNFANELVEISRIPDVKEQFALFWKSKHFELLEQHKVLLDNKLKEYFESK